MGFAVPCVPRLYEVEIDCLTNSGFVLYEESAGAESYVVIYYPDGGPEYIASFECNSTSENICSVPSLGCSGNYTFTIQAVGSQCSSAQSNAFTTETAPCPPADVHKKVICDNNTVSVSWLPVPGAVTYTATLEHINEGTSCCTTSGTSCDITDLPCGEMYILSVMAEGRTCNSSQSVGDIVRTVNLRCSDNVASAMWDYNKGLGNFYRVKAVGDDGHMHECSSHENHCDLTDLHCGEYYTVTVQAEDRDCTSKPSDSVRIKTVPCTPASIGTTVDCEANALIVSWSESLGADSYIATVEDSNTQVTTCQATTEGSCNVTGLGCGLIYHASVVSSDGYCNSQPTPVIDISSVPCKPRHIKAVMDCNSRTALVAWFSSGEADKYVVTAISASGHNDTCETVHTNCELHEMLCGQSYSISVKAVGGKCSSIGHMDGVLVTEPCIPEHITSQYSMTFGQVQWDTTAGADYYTVEGLTSQGRRVSCSTTDTDCTLYNMGCGQVYNISVTANNEACNGSTSTEPNSLKTEPCPPQNVQTNVHCQNDVGTVSWESSTGAVAYETSLTGRDGHTLSCNTDKTFCDVNSLHCGVIYYVNVVAIGETLNSSASNTVLLTAAPCRAENVAAHMDCENNTAEITWSFASGADTYMVTALATNGHRATCQTDEDHCELNNLQCGEAYMVSLTTIDAHCQIETQTNVTFSTRHCKPLRVGVDMACGTSTASMYWDEADGVELYMATAHHQMGMFLQCNSTNSTCQFHNLECGETYEFSVTAYGSMCYSETSDTVEIQTGPCQPTGLTEKGSCDNDTVVLDWLAADGALRYVVRATGNLGYVDALQTSETTAMFDLPCGQEYTFTVMAQDDRCDSAVSTFSELKTGPCVPQDVQTFTHCENNLGMASWAMSDGAETYMAIAVGEDSHTHVCVTNTTNCTWDDLDCGDHYSVHVIALDENCTSMPSNSTARIRMAPCIPQMVESHMNCTIKVATMSWNASETATSYIATAQTNSGHKMEVSTNVTWTFFSELQCGQEYFLSVQASDSECTSQPSQPSRLYSEPCSPTSVSSKMNCIFNIAAVSWTGSAGADFYTATVTQRDGQSLSCYSDEEQCGIPNVQCGQNYTVTVVATRGDCQSDPSEPDMLQSVPCIPTDVAVKLDCSTDQAFVSWSASKGALLYNVTALSTQGEISHCETSDQLCTLTKLVCGQSYSVQVVASDNICSSLPSPATHFNTAPCTPIPGSVVLDCYTNSALFEWAFAEGAVTYTATAQSSRGHVSTCTTNLTNCELEALQCGETYDVRTVASNGECSSPSSASLQVESVPCAPEGLAFELTCSTNKARVEWEASRGADYYIVQAFGVEEDETGCETTSLSCILPDLMCGFTYNISVLAVNSVCNVSRSEIKQLQAVPCVPQQVEARVVCESGVVAVSWEPSKGATSYTTVAQGNGGYASACNSSQTTCDFDDLLCGLSYSVTVSASDETCSSAESSAVDINTEDGVSSYMVQAFGPDGHRPTCNSTSTSCQLSDMHCGQLYNLTVTAKDHQCGSKDAFLTLQSVPCKPTNVRASLLCHSNTAAVTWERASGALSYLAVGVPADGGDIVECQNTDTYCDLTDLQCGQTYTVVVFSVDDSCTSVESDKAYVRTGPCPPQNVAVESECDADAMSVSWSPNPDAQYFHVLAVSNTGARLPCNSSDNSCTLSNLPCGQSYNITVLSVRDGCESKPSAVVETSSAPCPPRNANVRLECVTDGVWVTWDVSEGAVNYIVRAIEAGGHNSSCTATGSHCQVSDLKCATNYTLRVYAVNDYCESSESNSTTLQIETGPCALTAVNATTECNSDTIFVEWEPTHDTPIYLVNADGHDNTVISCNSTTTSCELSDVRCDMHYSIIVIASSDKCSSLRSKARKHTTAPCPPQNVTVEPSCKDNGVTVSWAQSPVAISYQLVATASDGHSTSCSTTVNNCTLSDLHCGQMYRLSVVARGENCTSEPSTLDFQSVPCDPAGLTVTLDCNTNSASLSWDASQGAVEYFACAQSLDGDALHCSSTVNSCTIEGLECGDIYNFSVEASNGACNSSFSPPVERGAVPCAPQNVKYTGTVQSATISWDMSVFATRYTVYSVSGLGRNILCSTTMLSCHVIDFDPDTFEMTASNAVGESIPTRTITGLEIPTVLNVTGSGVSLYVKWKMVKDATEYSILIEEGRREQQAEQKPILRIVEGDFYIETDLKPWTTYCIRLAARNTMNQSNYSQPMCRTTGAS
ncbi:Fibronectin type III domain-containing protein 7 [Collichthys lucidus]|uniref:Fibronectin type III domain-containing protein 7 n=1 Tax=Collichthys lucidus TaxID=240159 RepID=A0A4U5UJ78_COLLU|nr:Fibronectin type III domain-containing protein 7 [Collichthys lucidus]